MGANMAPSSWEGIAVAVLVFSLFVLIGNPLILLLIMSWQGYSRKISFHVGLTVAQISEFSLILIAAGMSMGHIDQNTLTIVTLVGLITITACSYLMTYSERLYDFLLPLLRVLTPFAHERDSQDEVMDARIILLLASSSGWGLRKQFRRRRFVVDHDHT